MESILFCDLQSLRQPIIFSFYDACKINNAPVFNPSNVIGLLPENYISNQKIKPIKVQNIMQIYANFF